MSGIFGVPVGAAYHLVFALTHLLSPVAGALAAAAAVVLFTAAVRLLISPLSLRALRGQAALARLAPKVQALRTRFARQPERLQRELTALYQREGASLRAGLLPVLAQWPFLSVTYLLFRSGTVDGARNQLLSDGLFGVPLGSHWLSGASLLSTHDAVFLAVFAVLAALCWLSARLAGQAGPVSAPAPAPGAAKPSAAPSATSGTAAGLLTRLLPYVTLVIAAFAPLAAGLYLITTVAWTTGERRFFRQRTSRRDHTPAAAGTDAPGAVEPAAAPQSAAARPAVRARRQPRPRPPRPRQPRNRRHRK